MSEIRFEGVVKRYSGGVEVIRDLNLQIREGEFVVLVGPSGCAKSTTLRMIAGLESISDGDLFIDGTRANDLSPGERNISMVFQSYALFPNMSVRENLAFGMRIRKAPQERIDSEIDRIANVLGLTPLLDRKPRQLSGGQAQRVALGRAMIRQPSAYLFDEPLSNLDAELRVQMRGEISQMQKQLGTTTVYVTHDQVEAMTMGDRIAVMNKGRIMQMGSPIELYESPANIFVAGFIGSPRMNFIALKDGFAFGQKIGCEKAAGGNITVGVRPEHICLSNGESSESAIRMKGKVQRIEDLGHEVLVQVVNPEGDGRLTLRAPGDVRRHIRRDSEVDVEINRNRLHFFDADTGGRIE
jgi:ABC-type sugar transport system ATPase subunit